MVIHSLRDVSLNYLPYRKWIESENRKDSCRENLYNQNPLSVQQLELAKSNGESLLRVIDIMDDETQEYLEDINTLNESVYKGLPLIGLSLGASVSYLFQKNKSIKAYIEKVSTKNQNLGNILKKASTYGAPSVGLILSAIGSIFYSEYLTNQSARIARWKAREDALDDPRNFVIYDQNQIHQAKRLVSYMPLRDDIENLSLNPLNFPKLFQKVKENLKNKKDFYSWLESEEKKSDFRTRITELNFAEKQLEKGKLTQDILFRLVRKIDIKAINYQENIKTACNILLGTIIASGAALPVLLSTVLKSMNKSIKIPKLNIISPICTFASVIVGNIITEAIFEKSLRVGRYKAKEEFVNNPYNFVYFSDEEVSSINQIKNTTTIPKYLMNQSKTYIEKLKSNHNFIKQIIKDFKDYDKHQKTTAKEKDRFYRSLKLLKVSPEQLKEAKYLQDKTFMVFNKIDVTSRRYQEDVSQFCDLSKMTTPYITAIAGFSELGLVNLIPKKLHDNLLGKAFFPIASFLFLITPTFLIEYLGTHVNSNAKKIGIMSALNELKDPKYFVDYTQEQIDYAENIDSSIFKKHGFFN